MPYLVWQSFHSLPIYIFEHHKVINSSVMYKIFFEIFLIIYFSIIFNVAKLIKIDVKTKKTNKNINI